MDEPLIFQATEKKVVVPETKPVANTEDIEKRKQKFGGSSIETPEEIQNRKDRFSTENKEDIEKRKNRFGSTEETIKEALEHKDKHELRKMNKKDNKGKGSKDKKPKGPKGGKKPEKTVEAPVAKEVVKAVMSEEEKKRQERFK